MRSMLMPLFGWLAFGFVSLIQAQDGSAPAKAKYVVLISVDGLAASYFDHPRADLPSLRKLAEQGARAKGMITSFPSVTWPSHTSLVTGVVPAKHGVLGNSVWSRDLKRGLTYIGDPELTKDKAIRVPTLYDAVHARGLTCASVIWPCCNGAKSLSWVIPDSNKEELHREFTTPGFAKELAEVGIDIAPLGKWGWDKQRARERDLIYTRVADFLLAKKHVNLLLLHLITPDGVEHNYGPHTPEAYQAVRESDDQIREIWERMQTPPFRGQSTLFVVSDHGFAPYEKLIRPNAALREWGWITVDDSGKPQEREAWCVAQGGSAFIYFLGTKLDSAKQAELKEKLAAIEGVSGVLAPHEFAKLGLPNPAANHEAPDLILKTEPGYSFNDAITGPIIAEAGGLKGTHGHDPTPEYMHATFVAVGAGIKPGMQLERIQNVDVAPTIAHLLGIKLPNVDGRVLKEILTD